MSDSKVSHVMQALYEIAVVGISKGCTDYIINLNRGQKEVMIIPSYKKPLQIMCDLYSSLINTKNPLIQETLDVKPDRIAKIYYHDLQDTMVIGVLTDINKPADFILEQVV